MKKYIYHSSDKRIIFLLTLQACLRLPAPNFYILVEKSEKNYFSLGSDWQNFSENPHKWAPFPFIILLNVHYILRSVNSLFLWLFRFLKIFFLKSDTFVVVIFHIMQKDTNKKWKRKQSTLQTFVIFKHKLLLFYNHSNIILHFIS